MSASRKADPRLTLRTSERRQQDEQVHFDDAALDVLALRREFAIEGRTDPLRLEGVDHRLATSVRQPDRCLRASSHASSCLPIGSARMRLPVAVKMALINAGAKGGTPGSPTPLGGVSGPGGTMWTLVTSGASSIRITGKLSKLPCCTLPSLKVISPYLARLKPMMAAPSLCASILSGLTNTPQSMAVSTW